MWLPIVLVALLFLTSVQSKSLGSDFNKLPSESSIELQSPLDDSSLEEEEEQIVIKLPIPVHAKRPAAEKAILKPVTSPVKPPVFVAKPLPPTTKAPIVGKGSKIVVKPVKKTFVAAAATPAMTMNCQGKENGAYGFGGCSSVYYLCWDKVASEQQCPEDTFFDEEKGWCDEKEVLPACGGIRTTLAPSTQAVQLVTVAYDCSSDGDFAPAGPCQSIYVKCSNGIALEAICPTGLVFDIDHSMCDFPSNIPACGGQTTTLRPVEMMECPQPNVKLPASGFHCTSFYIHCMDGTPGTKQCDTGLIFDPENKQCSPKEQVSGCAFDCSSKSNGAYGQDCSPIYFYCNEGEATRLQCPHGMVFDDLTAGCSSEPQYVVSCGGAPTTLAPTQAPQFLVETIPFDCSSLEDGDYPLESGKCLPDFAKCVGGMSSAIKSSCPTNLVFDPVNMLCDFPENIIACGGHPTEASPPERPNFSCPSDGNYPMPSLLCTPLYIECDSLLPSIQHCAKGQLFNEKTRLCAVKSSITECNFDCKGKENGDYSSGVCAAPYFSCWNGVATKQMCIGDTVFDDDTSQCDFRTFVLACGGSPRTTSSIPPPVEQAPSDGGFCSGKPDGSYVDGCSQDYYACSGGSGLVMSCPNGLVFNLAIDQCDYKANVDACGGKLQTTVLPKVKIATKKQLISNKLPKTTTRRFIEATTAGYYEVPETTTASYYEVPETTTASYYEVPETTTRKYPKYTTAYVPITTTTPYTTTKYTTRPTTAYVPITTTTPYTTTKYTTRPTTAFVPITTTTPYTTTKYTTTRRTTAYVPITTTTLPYYYETPTTTSYVPVTTTPYTTTTAFFPITTTTTPYYYYEVPTTTSVFVPRKTTTRKLIATTTPKARKPTTKVLIQTTKKPSRLIKQYSEESY